MRTRSIRNLLELPLVTTQQIHMGDVQDLLIDLAEQRVVKLAISWLADDRQVSGPELELPFNQIVNFDPHQILVEDEIGETAGLELETNGGETMVWANQALLDRKVITESGRTIGSVADLFIDEEDGAILGYELTTPETDQTAEPSRLLPPTTMMELRPDTIVVPDRLEMRSLESLHTQEDEELEEEEVIFERDETDARTQQPELIEEVQDPNEFPMGHRVGPEQESTDSYFE